MKSAGALLVLASQNPGKLRELAELLADLPVEVRSLADFPEVVLPEEGDAYGPNALAKARAAAEATGHAAVGDDSGLEVAALDGAPGPRSARYGGPGLDDAARCARLLEALREVPPGRRSARFVCHAALVIPGGRSRVHEGECRGEILPAPRGTRGFGYDPIFRPEGFDVSMAELGPAEKHRISHRGSAFARLRDDIAGFLSSDL